jgi:hypothetical protein
MASLCQQLLRQLTGPKGIAERRGPDPYRSLSFQWPASAAVSCPAWASNAAAIAPGSAEPWARHSWLARKMIAPNTAASSRGRRSVAGALFVLRERRAREPLLPLRLFRSVSLSAGTVLVILLMFALFGAMFFMTFYLENVHGADPVKTGLWLLPMTGMLIIGSPVSGILLTRLGPRIPLAVGMLLAAVALFGLSRLNATSSPSSTTVWFLILGLGLSPVIVGATDVIVGNAPVELAGVAGGLQSTAMQVGGTLGTAILGGVMSARVSSLLPARWNAAHLPPLTPAQLAAAKNAVSVGVAPVKPGIPAQIAAVITRISHDIFTSGMNAAFLTAAIVALAGAAIALLIRDTAGHDQPVEPA